MSNTEKRQGRTSKRDQLLDAAASIVSKQGVQQLTIDAVALAANVTKAGDLGCDHAIQPLFGCWIRLR